MIAFGDAVTHLPFENARALADAVFDAGAARGLRPLAVAVLDAGGHDLVRYRADRAGFYRAEIARAKAASCLGMGEDGGALAERAAAAPAFYAALAATVSMGMLPMPGGLLIRDGAGDIVGAIGVSGDTGANDELAIRDGLAAVGMMG